VRRALVLLTLLPLLPAFSCGGEAVDVDPGYFDALRFDCDPQTETPSCPPFSCDVDASGKVTGCDESCELDPGSAVIQTAFSFQGPEGVDLCAPRECVVHAQNAAPTCTPECSPDDTTTFRYEYDCRT
jgi:hypothetical protein